MSRGQETSNSRKYFAGAVDDFVVMSRSVGADMAGFAQAGQRVVYHPHPVYDNFGEGVSKEEACAALGLDAEAEYVLFFGFIRDYKGLDLLLEAWALVLQTSGLQDRATPPPRLLVAGEYYGNREAYEAQVDRLDLKESVVLHTHFIPNDAVRYYFSAASLVVQPYKTATQSGISQMAYHFGVPMVVTAVGGLPEIVPDGDAGYVVPRGCRCYRCGHRAVLCTVWRGAGKAFAKTCDVLRATMGGLLS